MVEEDNQSDSTPLAAKSPPIPGEQAASPTEFSGTLVAEDNQLESTPLAPKSPPITGEQAASRTESPPFNLSELLERHHRSLEIFEDAVAKAAAKPFQPRDPKVWAVLTAVSNKARQRKQGLNMVLKANVHFIGRLVEDYQFRIDSRHVSGEHCKIYRQMFFSEDDALKSQPVVFLKDNSSNGTYVNGERLTRRDDAVQIHHGDIISFLSSPKTTRMAYAFVYREVVISAASSNGVVTKRKTEELASEIERVKGIGVGAPEGPISLDDFGGLQRSNTELRKQLEEMKNQIKELQVMVDAEHKELVEASKICDEQKHTVDDLNGRLAASLQSYTEANEIMKSSKEVLGVSSKHGRLYIIDQASQGGVDDECDSEEDGSHDNRRNLKRSGGNNQPMHMDIPDADYFGVDDVAIDNYY